MQKRSKVKILMRLPTKKQDSRFCNLFDAKSAVFPVVRPREIEPTHLSATEPKGDVTLVKVSELLILRESILGLVSGEALGESGALVELASLQSIQILMSFQLTFGNL